MTSSTTNVRGELRSVDVRMHWTNEAAEFTPWLAAEDNIARLGQAIGIELEVESCEVAVGPYSADILARDSASGEFVVIENQLGKTDHDHLGKALTYSAVLDASTIVWIATEFTVEQMVRRHANLYQNGHDLAAKSDKQFGS